MDLTAHFVQICPKGGVTHESRVKRETHKTISTFETISKIGAVLIQVSAQSCSKWHDVDSTLAS